ncbi:MAG: HAMP domain-containing sensor histidine kinase [Clostridium sp.]|uniref:sensor histidine kinase n=1 Tax=Clostridium sp. TaxID=1506 RepID=UPI00303C95F0
MINGIFHKFTNLKSDFDSIDDFESFENIRVKANISRMNYPMVSLIPLNAILILIDLIYYNCMSTANKAYFYLYISHIVILLVGVIWIFYHSIFEKISVRHNELIHCAFTNIIIYWGVFMSVNLFDVNHQISPHIIISFTISAIFCFSPIVALVTNGLAYILMLIFLNIIFRDIPIGMHNIVNLTFTFIFSTVVSMTIYYYYIKDYINKVRLVKSNKKLEELESSKNDFFANVSHELKTPLNILYNSQQMIEITTANDGYNNEDFRKYMKIIKQNTNRLNRLIGNLIDITKIDASCFKLKLESIDIIKIVEDIVLSTVCYIESKGLNIIFDTDTEELVMECDPDSIERIILNLLSNAIKFTEKGGNILVNIICTNNYISISVQDDGIGIPKHMTKDIFNRFIQVDKSTNRRKDGSGIGLALVKSLVEFHDGEIKVESDMGKGSTFTFTLPIVLAKEPEMNIVNVALMDKNVERIHVEFSDIYN